MTTSNKLSEPGQFDLELANIITSEGVVVDLTASVVQVQFFESIESNSITGYLIVQETVGLTNVGPLIGQEYLQILISTPSLKGKKSKIDFTKNLLHVTSMIEQNEENNTTFTTFEFVTSELVHSKRRRINRPLEGEYSALVTTLLQNDLQCKKDLYIETSMGTKHVIPHNRTPFNMIAEFARQAVSKEHGSPTYHFYENLRGFHFRSLESMYAEGSKYTYANVEPGAKTGKEPGLSDGKVMDEKLTRDLAAIQDYTVTAGRHLMVTAPSGGFSSTLTSHNIFHKNYTVTTFNYFDDYEPEPGKINNKRKMINFFSGEKDNPLYSHAFVDKEERRISDFTYTTFLAPDTEIRTRDSQADFNSTDLKSSQYDRWSRSIFGGVEKKYLYHQRKSPNWLQRRRANLLNLNSSGALAIEVFGNTALTCGDTVTVNLPEASFNGTSPDGLSRFYRGVHLVKTLKHTFDIGAKRHMMNLVLYKDSVKQPFEFEDRDGFVETKPVKSGKVYTEEQFYSQTPDYDEKVDRGIS